jgi:hypothetical protein
MEEADSREAMLMRTSRAERKAGLGSLLRKAPLGADAIKHIPKSKKHLRMQKESAVENAVLWRASGAGKKTLRRITCGAPTGSLKRFPQTPAR